MASRFVALALNGETEKTGNIIATVIAVVTAAVALYFWFKIG